MNIICGTHGHCFDGLASATLFRAWMKETRPSAEVKVISLGYGAKQTKPTAELLSGDENAVFDFRYEPLPSLTYYFDHHPTAFADTASLAHFETRRESAPDHFVYDPKCKSCTKLLATHLVERGVLDVSFLAPLISWADIVDSANFESAAAATDTTNPILQMVSVVEQFGDDELLNKLSLRLLESSLLDVATSPVIKTKFAGLSAKYEEYQRRVRDSGKQLGRVAFIDLSEKHVSATTKFTQYAVFPEALYSVILLRLASGFKISAGYNPWTDAPCDRDVGSLCARFGGGGHKVVGGISFPRDDAERAVQTARTLVEELS